MDYDYEHTDFVDVVFKIVLTGFVVALILLGPVIVEVLQK